MKNSFEHYLSGEQLYDKMIAPVCQKHGLTHIELNILLFLANNPVYDTATQIVKYRRLTKSHVSTTLRSLQERGMLRGEYQGGNHRTVHLRLLDASGAAIADGQLVQKEFTRLLFSGFTEKEKETLQNLMERIDANIDRLTEEYAVRERENSGE